jgi:hypothetical protein
LSTIGAPLLAGDAAFASEEPEVSSSVIVSMERSSEVELCFLGDEGGFLTFLTDGPLGDALVDTEAGFDTLGDDVALGDGGFFNLGDGGVGGAMVCVVLLFC